MTRGNVLLTRVISALVGVSILGGVAFFFRSTGLVILCLAVNSVVSYEYSKILMVRNKLPLILCVCFALLSSGVIVVGVFKPALVMGYLATILTLLITGTLLFLRRSEDLRELLGQITMLILGVVYCGLLPATVTCLLTLQQGELWFLTYLAIVFAGDTSAYFSGKLFGRSKVLPTISPKKTWAGTYGGLAGSCVVISVVRYFFFTEVPFYWLLPLTVLTEALAQSGDFFESLIKRVASVKDSGRFMPGHGGLMDRVDGVYFAAPLFYLAASYFETVYLI